MNELTKETHILVLRDGTVIYLERQQAMGITTNLQTTIADFIMIGERLVMRHAISYLVPIADYEETLRRKKGEWKCRLGHWHRKDEQSCAEIMKQEEEMVELLDNGGRINITEILKDQKLRKENQKYERDETRKGWRRVGQGNV